MIFQAAFRMGISFIILYRLGGIHLIVLYCLGNYYFIVFMVG